MLKRLLGAKWWVIGGLVCAIGIPFMAYQKHRAADKYRSHRAEYCASLATTPEQEKACEEEKASSSDYLPWGYELFEWPNGITAWGLLLTLGAIVWQAWEVRKAAEIAGKQLAFQKEALRPRLSIVKFTKATFQEAMAGKWVTIQMEISNSGGMPAYNVVADTWIEFIPGFAPYRFSSNARFCRSPPMNVHNGVPMGFFVPLYRRLTDQERREMAAIKGAVCFRVKLIYRAFADDVYTDEAFILQSSPKSSVVSFSPG